MRNRVLILVLTLFALGSAYAQETKPAPEPLKIKVGDMAPDFTLLQFNGEKLVPVALHDFRGKKQVALAFFVFAFTGG